VLLALAVLILIVLGPAAWTMISSSGHRYTAAHAPDAPVAIVFGAELARGGATPKPFLAGRLDVAAELYRSGKVRALLVSGDAAGASGDEAAAMTRYLTERGVPARAIVADPHGLDSYDTCARAAQVYGVRRALLVSQSFHLPRAVTICRRLGIDADGVDARCDGCRDSTLRANTAREAAADFKAIWDVGTRRDPAVRSKPDLSLTAAAR
jgi:vancomycin permeability regulator SanA